MTQFVTAESIRRATTALFDNDIYPDLSGEFDTDIGEMFEDSVTDYLENYFDGEFFAGEPDNAEEQAEYYVSEVTSYIANEIETRRYYGAENDMVDGKLIYASDIVEFYESNQSECDDMLTEVDTSGATSITEIMGMCANYALYNQLASELDELEGNLLNCEYDELLTNYMV